MDMIINILISATFKFNNEDKTMVIPKITKNNVLTTKAVSAVITCSS